MVPFLADCNANFIEKLLKPQLINKLQNICEKFLNTCSFEFIFPQYPQYLCRLKHTAHYGGPQSPDPLHCLNHHQLPLK